MTETVIVALISAIGGSLIKPLFDYLSQRDVVSSERDGQAYERAVEEIHRKDEEIKALRTELSSSDTETDKWRDKFYGLLVQTNMGDEVKSQEKSLREMLEDIIEDKQ